MSDRIETSALFVYGSLLDPALRHRLLGRDVRTIFARLSGYERATARYYFIAPRTDAATDGLVMRDLTVRDFEILDRYEEAPRLYTRELAGVLDRSGRRYRCWTYVPTEAGKSAAPNS